MQDDMIKIGGIFRAARDIKGMTQAGLAEVTGVDPRTIMDIENDKRFPTYEVLFKIIRILGISADQIFWPDKIKSTPEQEQIIREFLECSEWEQVVIMKTMRTLVRSLREENRP
ncbi:helix-turn-helix domain-containing protein [Ruminococcaceae bacterium OttesenSCG-928-A16]|nr:helix-turn-helix domain-containing protein [Ruminococcaceae bacterium OttesenSCG-928-A16]